VPETIYRQIFSRRYAKGICLPAHGTSGGIILTWKKSVFKCDGRILKENVITADLRLMMDDQIIRITGVYGPTTGTHRAEFLQQIREQKPMHDEPWMICGDFNLILRSQERSSGNMWPRDREFKNLINELYMMDIPLQGRKYTWSNGMAMAKLDRFLISPSWNDVFPAVTQKALPNITSDHCPLECQCSTTFPQANTFKFENYWLKLEDFRSLVQTTWEQKPMAESPHQLGQKLIDLRQAITIWRKGRMGDINKQEEVCKITIQWIERQVKQRTITPLEQLTKQLLKTRYEEISGIKETIWRQRAKRQWVKEGDKNTSYFHRVASVQKRQNYIQVLQQYGQNHSNHRQKARILFNYFRDLIGTDEQAQITYNLRNVYGTISPITNLTTVITAQEINQVIDDWPSHKAPGPDGFTGEFYKAFRQVIVPDMLAIYNSVLAQPDQTLQPLNGSYIVMIPKKKNATDPRDYRPISVINAIQRILSKILAARLQPHMSGLLQPTQTGFLKGRHILEGFYYAQEIVTAATK
jgi:Reverse transcriptase (RNA-dependent DNA polymerase)